MYWSRAPHWHVSDPGPTSQQHRAVHRSHRGTQRFQHRHGVLLQGQPGGTVYAMLQHVSLHAFAVES